MAKSLKYKNYLITSLPYKRSNGGFSTNGEINNERLVSELQGIFFKTETEADDWFIKEAKNLIDKQCSLDNFITS